MKKSILIFALSAMGFVQPSFAQDSTRTSPLSTLLTSYYAIKDALVAGNANAASSNAAVFLSTAKDMDDKTMPSASRDALVQDAGNIASAKDLNRKREYFARFSTDLFAVAKTVKLTAQPVYEMYCPMKKAYWLSNVQAVKNPYFGNAMLTCGKVVETLP
ncbi:DUF3347 domain-containing protein [Flavitalea flava]